MEEEVEDSRGLRCLAVSFAFAISATVSSSQASDIPSSSVCVCPLAAHVQFPPPTTMSLLPPLVAGALFGPSLLLSGVYSPTTITSQMHLSNFHMLQSFLVASAMSALVIRQAQAVGYAACPARTPRTLGYFPYDANVAGGLLVGAGMAITGACPGTVLVQIAVGVRYGWVVGVGSVLGGIVWTGVGEMLIRPKSETQLRTSQRAGHQAVQTGKQATLPAEHTFSDPAVPTLHALLKITPSQAVLLYETCLLPIALASALYAPRAGVPHWLHPLAGGVLIGCAQALSVLLTRQPVGVSAAYQDLGRWIWRCVSGGRTYPSASLHSPALVFAVGVVGGSMVVARSFGGINVAGNGGSHDAIEVMQALLGGGLLAFGAGLAGGCPSGHGISGMATLGIASFVSVASMFGAGLGVAWLLG